jgi:galactokinase
MKIIALAPGRVNLIGEHTDYNQGWVMPVAIDLKLTVKLALRSGRLFVATAFGFTETQTFHLEGLQPVRGKPDWIDYLKAVCWALEKNGYKLGGAELSIASEIPIGAGLSSSAALELAVAGALNEAFNLKIDPQNLALICQQAENEYIGVRCGIMDQYAIVLGRSGKALFLDCLSLDYSFVPFKLDQSKLLIVDSRVKRALGASEYNRRREECEEAVELIGNCLGRRFNSLREIGLEDLKEVKDYLPKIIYLRSRYIIEENARVLAAAAALEENDLVSFGYLLKRSHAGLRDFYAVSCPELDLIVDTASLDPQVFGARMTGAGFGGCAIILLRQEAVDRVCAGISKAFTESGWLPPAYYLTKSANGLTVEKK